MVVLLARIEFPLRFGLLGALHRPFGAINEDIFDGWKPLDKFFDGAYPALRQHRLPA